MAFAIAFLVNFTAARQWAFASTARGGNTRRQLRRYLVLVGLNLLSTLVIVVGLSAGGHRHGRAEVVGRGDVVTGEDVARGDEPDRAGAQHAEEQPAPDRAAPSVHRLQFYADRV